MKKPLYSVSISSAITIPASAARCTFSISIGPGANPIAATPILVATCGNEDAADDGFGPRVGRRLRAERGRGLRVLELGMQPTALLDHLSGDEVLILVDAVRSAPSTAGGGVFAVDLDAQEMPPLVHEDVLSSHGLGVAQQLALARALRIAPRRAFLVGMAASEWSLDGTASGGFEEHCRQGARVVLRLVRSLACEDVHL